VALLSSIAEYAIGFSQSIAQERLIPPKLKLALVGEQVY